MALKNYSTRRMMFILVSIGGRHVIRCVADYPCLDLAMRDALEKDSRIHRDISVGNVILVKEPGTTVRRGYLIDWETSCKVDNTGAAMEAGRVVSGFVFAICITQTHRNVRGPGNIYLSE